MAKVKQFPLSPGAFSLARGRFVIRDTRWGQVAQKWPKKRPKAKEGGPLWHQQQFARAAVMAANPNPLDLGTAIEMVKGTTYVPRDFLMMCAYGYAYVLQGPDGQLWQTRLDMSSNPQYLLDLVTDTHGSMLYRADYGWIGLDPSSNGYILTMKDGFPEWLPNAGASVGGAKVTTLQITNDQASVAASTFVCTFDAATIDENEVWDPLNPTRLYIPADAEKVRFTTSIYMKSLAVSTINRVQTLNPSGSEDWIGACNGTHWQQSPLAAKRQFTDIGPWIPRPAFDYVTFRVVSAVAQNTGLAGKTTVTMEVM